MPTNNKQFTLYVHQFPNNKLYFGITTCTNVHRRWKSGRGYETQTLIYKAIQKYGWDNIQHIVLLEGLSKEVACECEKYLIAKYQTQNPKYGYNVYLGGDVGRLGIPLSLKEKQRLVSYNKGRPKTKQELKKIKQSLSKYWTKARRKQFGEQHGGHGFYLSETTALNIYNELCEGKERKELAIQYNVSKTVIDKIANKKYWSLRNSTNTILSRKLPTKYIYQYDIQNNFIKSWNTFEQIHKQLSINVSTVCECCNHKRSKTHGYIWKYVLVLDNGKEVVL